MKIARYSCRCTLCKQRWTTTETDRTKAYTAHGIACAKYQKYLKARFNQTRTLAPAGQPMAEVLNAERYQMSVLFFNHLQIEGRMNADKRCDARCTGAAGHQCECSCGGENHGIERIA